MKNQKDIRVGVIGCGVIFGDHIRAYRQVEGVTVKTACDIIPGKAEKKAAEYEVPCFETDAAKVFADPEIDAVSICTDHFSHAELSIAALDAGKHVLCEKPLSSCKENMDAMIKAGERHPELVFSGIFQHRFNPVFRYFKELIDSGKFGKVMNACLVMQCLRTKEYYESTPWRGKWKTEGGSVTMNQAIHTVDILQWLMGGAAEIKGFFDNRGHKGIIETEDCVSAALRFNNGALGSITASSASHLNWEPTISIFGVDSTLEIRNEKLLRFDSSDKALVEKVLADIKKMGDVQAANADKTYYGIGHPRQVADFIASIREHRRPFVTAADARAAVDLMQKLLDRE